ncbi:MAG: argininosuccinate lyase [Atopobiaceae bacterium]|nr:argininosuccinate lyase [Atopobiaceae bacterium]
MAHTGAKPLWGGRFSASPEGELELFGASLPFDQRLWKEDIRGSKAHAQMLGAQGIISEQDVTDILRGLDEIYAQIEAGEIVFDASEDEDIHMAVERRLTELIGEAGGRLHTGRSRNDQVALDFRMACRSFAEELQHAITELQSVLLRRAEEEFGTVMPGYTHLQLAQPILLSQHLLTYFWQLSRDFERSAAAYTAADACPLGSAALAGTTYPLDRNMTAEALGFSSVMPNSLDAVSDRDFACDLVYACMMCQLHLSRICEELVIWSSTEFGFIEMDDSHATGSSIMPQKKNPDFAELVRGKTGRVVGDLVSLATTIKGIPLAYDKDLQEDKEPVFDAIDTLIGSLHAVRGMIDTMAIRHERLEEASRKGYMAATDLADYLVGQGMPFREAHGVVGRIVADCVSEGIELQDLSLDELRSYSAQFDEGALDALDIAKIVERRVSYGGTGNEAVRVQLTEAKQQLTQQLGRME